MPVWLNGLTSLLAVVVSSIVVVGAHFREKRTIIDRVVTQQKASIEALESLVKTLQGDMERQEKQHQELVKDLKKRLHDMEEKLGHYKKENSELRELNLGLQRKLQEVECKVDGLPPCPPTN